MTPCMNLNLVYRLLKGNIPIYSLHFCLFRKSTHLDFCCESLSLSRSGYETQTKNPRPISRQYFNATQHDTQQQQHLFLILVCHFNEAYCNRIIYSYFQQNQVFPINKFFLCIILYNLKTYIRFHRQICVFYVQK